MSIRKQSSKRKSTKSTRPKRRRNSARPHPSEEKIAFDLITTEFNKVIPDSNVEIRRTRGQYYVIFDKYPTHHHDINMVKSRVGDNKIAWNIMYLVEGEYDKGLGSMHKAKDGRRFFIVDA